jgi:uncharacterized protein YceK
MRTIIAVAFVTVALAGCSTISRSTGAGGGAVMSGATKSPAAESGADNNDIATSGSNADDPTAGLSAH